MEEGAANLEKNPDVTECYLGMAFSSALKSYEDVKVYKQHKRWP